MARKFSSFKEKELVDFLKEGKIGVIPTDTTWGVVGLALKEDTVERIYKVKKRNPKKPLIILISSKKDLEIFQANLPPEIGEWPEKTSIILPSEKFPHLHRGGKTLAFRIPGLTPLRELIEKTGPLVAPSANREGEEIKEKIEDAAKVLRVDFYLESNIKKGTPSTLIKIEKGEVKVLREGENYPNLFPIKE